MNCKVEKENFMHHFRRADESRSDVPASPSSFADREQLAIQAARLLDKHRGVDVAVYDVRGPSGAADYMVVATGTSRRHLTAMADRLAAHFAGRGQPPLGVEGRNGSTWVLIDFGAVVVHLFDPPVRAYYDIDAPDKGRRRIEWTDAAQAKRACA
jgi:ribosome-associated protein